MKMALERNRISTIAVILASFSLILSGCVLIWFYVKISSLENRENSIEEVKWRARNNSGHQSRPNFCNQLPDPGPCKSQIQRWYFLEREEDCLEFPWGGCQGNNNNFLSLEQCRSACSVPIDKPRSPHLREGAVTKSGPVLRIPPPARDTFDIASCKLLPEAGPCNDRITRYYYDSGSCRKFEYGGCAGNANNFFTENECQRKCRASDSLLTAENGGYSARMSSQVAGRSMACYLPEEKGECDGSEVRYRWDDQELDCTSFLWSGCGGNANNFVSLEKCRKRCKSS